MSPQTSSGPRGGIPRLRPVSIALLSYGFRPFFLGAALWACIAMVLWIGLLSGSWSFAIGYGVVAWHAHEFLFGYIAAVMTGFLLTAIPNWTGRLPLQGMPLTQSIIAAVPVPIQSVSSIAARPASHNKNNARSGMPCSGNRPVQFGIAVKRKPVMTAAM